MDRTTQELHICPYCKAGISWRVMFRYKKFKCPSCNRSLESNRKEVLETSVKSALVVFTIVFTLSEIFFHYKFGAAAEAFKLCAYTGLGAGWLTYLYVIYKKVKIKRAQHENK